mgnify:CR=1 FL=1
MKNKCFFFLVALIFFHELKSDSFNYNSYNNHGIVGLINMPSARFYDESSFGITLYGGDPDQKLTFTSSPFDWLEASFFYTNIDDKPYCSVKNDPVCDQDYKDKGFNFKLRLKEEGIWPAIAIGINDIAGTGLYGSEYIVGSYGINKTDIHFGLGWGNLNGSKETFRNPLGNISDNFFSRPNYLEDEGGQFQPSRYFSGETISPFFGITHVYREKTAIKFEYDTTVTPGPIGYKSPKNDFSFGFDFFVNENLTIGVANERGNTTSIRFIYKNNPKITQPSYKYKKSGYKETDNEYKRFIRNVNNNGISVNKIIETKDAIGIQLTQFTHPSLDIIDEIIRNASKDAGIRKEIKKDLRIADLQAISEYDEKFIEDSKLIFERPKKSKFNTNTNISFRPFLASRERFFAGALLLENNSEFVITDNFLFSSNIKYSIADNFKDLVIPPKTTFPEQVRSDIKDYLRNFDNGIFIGRAQFDYHITPKKNHHFMATAGILEEMFSGYGFEYLYFKQDINYAFGFELFNTKKRDYRMRFGTLEYQNLVGHVNFYYRNYKGIPFDAKISYGEYLAGDEGVTLDLSRSFANGTKFGVFASFTDVSSEDFGEGSFDKGVYFNIPVFGNFINYSWRPLTKDPGAKLNRKHTLHDLLIKFRPIN